MENPESFREFLSGKMTEDEYINKHDAGKWPEIKIFLENPLLFATILRRMRNPGNRRNVLTQSLPIKRDELEKLLMSGSSLVTTLKRPSTRQIRPSALAKFCIIYRVPFSWGMREFPGEEWDFHNFDYLENCLVTTRKALIELLVPSTAAGWSINGYQLELIGSKTIYLRIDRRSDLVIVDLLNPNYVNLMIVIDIMSKVDCHWKFQLLPSLIVGHQFYVFFGAKKTDVIDEVVKEEYPLIKRLYGLSAIYGGN